MNVAKVLAIIVAMFPLACSGRECPSQFVRHEVDWSKSDSFQSPDCRWELTITPMAGDVAKAELVNVVSGSTQGLFPVERSGFVYWGRNDRLLFENHKFSNHYEIQLFRLRAKNDGGAARVEVDPVISAYVRGMLGSQAVVAYYFPKFVAWTPAGILVAVGVVTTQGGQGAFTGHCIGVEVGEARLRVTRTLSADQLHARYKTTCQQFP